MFAKVPYTRNDSSQKRNISIILVSAPFKATPELQYLYPKHGVCML